MQRVQFFTWVLYLGAWNGVEGKCTCKYWVGIRMCCSLSEKWEFYPIILHVQNVCLLNQNFREKRQLASPVSFSVVPFSNRENNDWGFFAGTKQKNPYSFLLHSNVLLMTRLRITAIWELLLPWNGKFLQRTDFLQASRFMHLLGKEREKRIVFTYWTFKSIYLLNI